MCIIGIVSLVLADMSDPEGMLRPIINVLMNGLMDVLMERSMDGSMG